MGTRADFYVGEGETAEWLGSIGWDGYIDGIDDQVLMAEAEKEFRASVESFFEGRDDVTLPDQGWPWPWNDSNTTDYAYMFSEGVVKIFCFGGKVFWDADGEEVHSEKKTAHFPDMSQRKSVASGNRSGLITIQSI